MHRVPLLGPFAHVMRARTTPGRLVTVAAGRTVPEVLAWSRPMLMTQLRAIEPAVVVTVTARAFDPAVAARWATVLDLVDRLSVSYRDRMPFTAGPSRRFGYRGLAWTAARFERVVAGGAPGVAATVAAGWADAEALSVEWVPILAEPVTSPVAAVAASAGAGSEPPVDVLFFGTLSYAPNVEAVLRLAKLWPTVLAARPGTTALIAGANPTTAVRDAVSRLGWRLEADFAELAPLAAQCRIAVAPLVHASGIQIKVLDAAALGLPQVVTPAALAGLAPAFPAVVAPDDDALVAGIVDLLASSSRQAELAAEAAAHVAEVYGVDRWLPWAASVLAAPDMPPHPETRP